MRTNYDTKVRFAIKSLPGEKACLPPQHLLEVKISPINVANTIVLSGSCKTS